MRKIKYKMKWVLIWEIPCEKRRLRINGSKRRSRNPLNLSSLVDELCKRGAVEIVEFGLVTYNITASNNSGGLYQSIINDGNF